MPYQYYQNSNSLVQINQMFSDIAINLAYFNSYGEGAVKEIGAVTVNNYPLLWNEIYPVSIKETYTVYTMRIYTCDLVFPDLKNRIQVQSDALTSLHHVLYMLRDTYGLLIEWNDVNATPFIEQFNDQVGGWYADIKIEIPWSFGGCDAPRRIPFSNNILDYDINSPLAWEPGSGLLWS
jgi:hypothetical protein